jgi:hypothetical protein
VRDNTEDWVIPRGTVPTLNQLEARIDEALVIARASEEGVREVGEMALDAARQARRAAEAAEASARAAVEATTQTPGPAGPVSDTGLSLPGESSASSPPAGGADEERPITPPTGRDAEEGQVPVPQPRFEVRFRSFTERADRLSARLRALQDHPSHRGASVAAVRRRGDG